MLPPPDTACGTGRVAIYQERALYMKPFTAVAAVIFALVAPLHLLRLLLGWQVTVNGTDVPLWASAPAAVIAAVLAVMLAREARK